MYVAGSLQRHSTGTDASLMCHCRSTRGFEGAEPYQKEILHRPPLYWHSIQIFKFLFFRYSFFSSISRWTNLISFTFMLWWGWYKNLIVLEIYSCFTTPFEFFLLLSVFLMPCKVTLCSHLILMFSYSPHRTIRQWSLVQNTEKGSLQQTEKFGEQGGGAVSPSLHSAVGGEKRMEVNEGRWMLSCRLPEKTVISRWKLAMYIWAKSYLAKS